MEDNSSFTSKSIASRHRQVIIALDIDAFYVAASRIRDPSLHGLPIGIKQKSLMATVSYEARAFGVKKLDSIRTSLTKCPNMVLVNGEDLTHFRKVSHLIFTLVRSIVWDEAVEKLGLDELFCDVTAMIDNHLLELETGPIAEKEKVWFDLRRPKDRASKEVKPLGFWYDPQRAPGHVLPAQMSTLGSESKAKDQTGSSQVVDRIADSSSVYVRRIIIGAHLALYLRQLIVSEIGLTLSAGVSHCKTASKIVGAANKPNQQTCWIPPSVRPGVGATDDTADDTPIDVEEEANIRDEYLQTMLRPREVRSINGFGFAAHEKLKAALGQPGGAKVVDRVRAKERSEAAGDHRWWEDPPDSQPVTVDLCLKAFSAESFTQIFGARQGANLWSLLHGKAEEPVNPSPLFPLQISIEDTYHSIYGDKIPQQIEVLARSLLKRLETELIEGALDKAKILQPNVRRRDDWMHEQGQDFKIRSYVDLDDEQDAPQRTGKRRWLRFPLGLRLSIRQGPGNRTSRQTKMPVGIFDLSVPRVERAKQIVQSCMTMYKAMIASEGDKGYGINLLNIAALDLSTKRPEQSISSMFGSTSSSKKKATGPANGTTLRDALSRAGIDEEVFSQLPTDVQEEILASVRASSKSVENANSSGPTIRCEVCAGEMLPYLLHDHDRWPLGGMPSEEEEEFSIDADGEEYR